MLDKTNLVQTENGWFCNENEAMAFGCWYRSNAVIFRLKHDRRSYSIHRYQTMQPEIIDVTWSSKGIRAFNKSAMVVHLSAKDIYTLAVKAEVESLVDGCVNIITKAS